MDLSFFSPDKKPENPMGQLMSAPAAKAAPQQQDPMMAMFSQFFTAMMGGQQQDPLARGKNNAMTVAALRNDPVGDRNRAYMPGAMAGTPDAVANPFTNSFFKSSAANLTPAQLMQSQGGNAMNQLADPMRFQGSEPQGAMPFSNFGAPQSQVPGRPAPAVSPDMDQAMLDNAQLYAPSGNPFMDLFKRMRR
jgi:hypothetical protein